jgi:hypothetical protein
MTARGIGDCESGQLRGLAASFGGRARGKELFEQEVRDGSRVMSEDAVLFEEIVEDDAIAKFLERVKIDRYRLGALGAIAPGNIAGDGLAIGDDPVDDAPRGVLADRLEVVGERVSGGFAGLGHEISDVDARSFGSGDGVGDFGNQKVGEDAGVERAWTEQDEVGFADGFEGFGKGASSTRRKREALDAFAAGGDAGFAVDAAAAFESGDEGDVGDCGWKNLAADREDFAADADSFGEIASDMSESGEEEVAEIVADEAAAGVKAILEKTAEQGFVLAESDHAVADIAGRQDAIFAAQASGAAAVVGDRDDGGKACDGMFRSDFVAAAGDEIFEAAQKSGKAGASAEGDDVESGGRALRFAGGYFHDSGHDTIRFHAKRWHAKISGAPARAEFIKQKAG